MDLFKCQQDFTFYFSPVRCARCITVISRQIAQAQATISQHLRELKDIDIIQGTIEGSRVSYCINAKRWSEISTQFAQLFEQYEPTTLDDCCYYETIKITLDNNFISMKKYTPFFTVALVLFSLSSLGQVTSPVKINAELRKTTAQLVDETHLITEERKEQLIELGDFLIQQRTTSKETKVLFVCTHNSRRSHISDTWFQYGLVYYGISGYQSFSGGLEATAFNPNAIGALERAGFSVAFDKKIVNPVVSV